ncbi:KAP family P-loop NTPase fold protein [Streptomyces flavofungini]|uniref:KAP family P-loop NTPase fold protein n=1 Tax=Streptomyces flavofungini TaxID=68200 RepID=UPI0025B2021B|nr:P-loop NTPase fold protein [Streptomyces flavofungini]WJV45577.1 P-loop NTPase fold protein [Streptomyces flavofungini]
MLLTDNPIPDADGDHFGFRTHAAVLCAALTATEDLPLTVGVFGPWGMGKSSFMKVCQDLLDQHDIPTVWFNPWKYDQKDEIWHALIQSVLTEIAQDLEERRLKGDLALRERMAGALETIRRLSQAAAWLLARRAAGPLTGGVLTADDVNAAQTALTEPGTETYLHVNRFEQDFKEVVHTYTDGGRLVLFIDDLDRCSPDAAITVLDSLKLFLGEGSCVFVLAMDYQVVAKAAARRFHREDPDEARGRQYLEKLIHFPYHLPGVSFEAIVRHLQDKITDTQIAGSRELWELVEVAFEANPRRVRRFVNGLNLTAMTLRMNPTDPPSRRLLLHAGTLLALHMKHPDFFAALKSDPGVWRRFDDSEFFKTDLSGQDAVLAGLNPGVRRLLARVSFRREGYEFPEPPTPTEIRLLTQVLTVTGGLSNGSADPSASSTADGTAGEGPGHGA